jgi:hypothetical protein
MNDAIGAAVLSQKSTILEQEQFASSLSPPVEKSVQLMRLQIWSVAGAAAQHVAGSVPTRRHVILS